MLAPLEGDDRAEHGEPQEQDAGELIRPDQRLLEQVARGNAAEQHDDFRNHEQRGGCRDGLAKPLFGFLQGARHPGHPGGGDAGFLHDLHGDQPMLPAYFCSSAQASSPNLALASL